MRPYFSRGIRVVLYAMFTVAVLPCAALAAVDIGKVLALVPGASVLRDGKTETLALHAGIRVSDTIRTDASGRVKILFNDDSAVTLGSNTSLDMRDYADAGDKPAFGFHVPRGVVRAMTGKIVEQNPAGFRITTPEATVGIRGTTISLIVENGKTTVLVENTLRQVYVNNLHVPAGSKITIPGDPLRPERIAPEDRRRLGQLRNRPRQAPPLPRRHPMPLRWDLRPPTPRFDPRQRRSSACAGSGRFSRSSPNTHGRARTW